MDVIDTDMAFDNLNVPAQSDLAQDLAGAFGHIPTQHVVTILCHPYQVILDIVDRMDSFAILWHSMGPSRHGRSQESYSRFRAKAIRLKAKVLDPANGNKNTTGGIRRKALHFRHYRPLFVRLL